MELNILQRQMLKTFTPVIESNLPKLEKLLFDYKNQNIMNRLEADEADVRLLIYDKDNALMLKLHTVNKNGKLLREISFDKEGMINEVELKQVITEMIKKLV